MASIFYCMTTEIDLNNYTEKLYRKRVSESQNAIEIGLID
jgi:hypothetical protein